MVKSKSLSRRIKEAREEMLPTVTFSEATRKDICRVIGGCRHLDDEHEKQIAARVLDAGRLAMFSYETNIEVRLLIERHGYPAVLAATAKIVQEEQ